MENLIIPAAIIAAILTLSGIIIGIRNAIVIAKNRVQRGWADVIAWQRKKVQLIPVLEQAVHQYKQYEKMIMTKITALRTALQQLDQGSINYEALREVGKKTNAMIATAEAYPALRSSELYVKFMNEVSELEDNVASAIAIFNRNVECFNNSIQAFPGNLVNGMLNKEKAVETFTDTAAVAGIDFKPKF